MRLEARTASDVLSRAPAVALTFVAVEREAGVLAVMSIQLVSPLIALVMLVMLVDVSQRRGTLPADIRAARSA